MRDGVRVDLPAVAHEPLQPPQRDPAGAGVVDLQVQHAGPAERLQHRRGRRRVRPVTVVERHDDRMLRDPCAVLPGRERLGQRDPVVARGRERVHLGRERLRGHPQLRVRRAGRRCRDHVVHEDRDDRPARRGAGHRRPERALDDVRRAGARRALRVRRRRRVAAARAGQRERGGRADRDEGERRQQARRTTGARAAARLRLRAAPGPLGAAPLALLRAGVDAAHRADRMAARGGAATPALREPILSR